MISNDEYPWLAGLAELARRAPRSVEPTAVAVGDVVLCRHDELHVRPFETRFAGVHTITLRCRSPKPTIVVSAYLDAPVAPIWQDLERQLGAGTPLPVASDQIGEREYTMPVAKNWELPERSSWVITVGRGNRVTAVAIEVLRD